MGINVSLNTISSNIDFKSEPNKNLACQFTDGLSSAVEKTDTKYENKPLSIMSIPCGSGFSGGAAAKYADDSTEEDPIIQVIVSGMGPTERYNVHVNDVNPQNASQLRPVRFRISA